MDGGGHRGVGGIGGLGPIVVGSGAEVADELQE